MAPDLSRLASKIRVLVADSSRIHTQLLSDALRNDPDLEVTGWESDLRELTTGALARKVDVLAITGGVDAQPSPGLQIVSEFRVLHPNTKSILLIETQKFEAGLEAFRAGAKGIFNKNSSVEMFRKCIHCVHRGQIWADSRDVAAAVDALASSVILRSAGPNNLDLLSQREREVVRSLAQGLTNREIAERMGLSQHTIKNHLFRIFDKLGVSSRVELLFMALNANGAAEEPRLRILTQSPNEYGPDAAPLAPFRNLDEAELPAAQSALAQAQWARHGNPDDLVRAYMWNLIATQRMSQARNWIASRMTAAQVDEGERVAKAWLSQSGGLRSPALEQNAGSEPALNENRSDPSAR